MKDGHALCTSCGRQPEERKVVEENVIEETKTPLEKTLQKKLDVLSKELEQEMNHEKQQSILKSINLVLEMIAKIKEK
jgi:UPF0148 protein